MTDYPDETPSSGHWDGKVRAESTMAAILGSAHRELATKDPSGIGPEQLGKIKSI